MNGERETPVCPRCASRDIIPIAYGYPGPELAESARRGEVILGGCLISETSPTLHCNSCDHEWGRMGPLNGEMR